MAVTRVVLEEDEEDGKRSINLMYLCFSSALLVPFAHPFFLLVGE